MNNWIKKDDQVYILAGNDKGKTGVVLAKKGKKIIIQGINIRKKHVKKTQNAQSSQIINIERPIHISNVALCTSEGKKIKLKLRVNADKSKDLIYMKEGKEAVYRTIKKKKEDKEAVSSRPVKKKRAKK